MCPFLTSFRYNGRELVLIQMNFSVVGGGLLNGRQFLFFGGISRVFQSVTETDKETTEIERETRK